MLENYLIIHKDILPDYYEKVIEARRLVESGKVKDVSQAVKQVGISRSTYYKYKDYILEPIDIGSGRKAVLSALLSKISSAGGSVLTITQSLPIHGKASVTLSLDISAMPGSMAGLIESLGSTPGAEQVRLLAVE